MKILIIEDDKNITKLLKNILEGQMYIVEVTHDGERGSFLARTGKYDLIILDYNLPKMNGEKVLEELRKEKDHIPVLILSVRSELDSKKTAFSLGADDYLTKPFLFDELILRIKALLRRPARIANKLYKIDNLTVNTSTQIVRRGGKEIYLTRREFALLEYLVRQRGHIVSRSQILENVWDYNADPFSNSIETHLSSLRRKLNYKKNRNLIHTFTGRGYKLALNKLSAYKPDDYKNTK